MEVDCGLCSTVAEGTGVTGGGALATGLTLGAGGVTD